MAIDTDDEILQDFLVEAGELLEQLGEQLVELEKRPQDRELLNAVFRNFHTVKGGAGFLSLDGLVDVCHQAEDVFNVLRQGERLVDVKLMDVVLRALDVVNGMVDQVRNGVEPATADPALIAELKKYTQPGDSSSAEVVPQQEPAESASESLETTTAQQPQDVAGVEFEAMLDAAADAVETKAAEQAQVNIGEENDEISEDEFEALLDQLHGGAPAGTSPSKESAPPASSESSDTITEDEFERLLDELQAGTVNAVKPAPEPVAQQQVAPGPDADADSSQQSETVATKEVISAAAKPATPVASTDTAAKPAAGKDSGQNQTQAEATVRVDTKRLDDIMNLVGELVLVRNRLATLRGSMGDEVAKVVGNLDLVTADLQNSVMKTRMQPIKKVFGRFPRVVRDLARSLNKQVALELYGEETDLDKNLVEALADPLVHLVRNAVDHGVESPEVRMKAGKPEGGTVKLSAEQEGDHILLTIEDDGAGMNADLLRTKAVEKGLLDEDTATRLDDYACYNLIFMPGFSTKNEISDISGRGVGMDVVKTRITQLNGTIHINSTMGKGSRISIKVPLTLAIMPTLMVQLSNQIFALPLANVIEIFDRESARTSTVDGKEVVIVREKAIPLVFLSNWLVRDSSVIEQADAGYVVVVSYGAQHVGCVVDQMIGQEEVVIKPLGNTLQGTQGLAGATITGNGRIALILDMPGLMEAYGRRI